MNIYVGNLPYSLDDQQLELLFSSFGTVTRAHVIIDREMDRSRGFGFVEMDDDEAAKQAIEARNGFEVDGRKLVVNEARPREERPRRNFGGGGGGGKPRRYASDRDSSPRNETPWDLGDEPRGHSGPSGRERFQKRWGR